MNNIDTKAFQLVVDRQEIEQVLRTFSRAVDRLDLELLRSVYHPDAIDKHGVFEGNAHEFAAYIVDTIGRLTTYGFHLVSQSIIDVEGDIAAVESGYIGYHRIQPGEAAIAEYFGETYASRAKAEGTIEQEHDHLCGGRYIDRFERRNGKWKIARREITNEWRRCGVAFTDLPEGRLHQLNIQGKRDRTDPVYANLFPGG
ncbi:MAG: nuclear transport factor 2 family protein [Porticoccaceae bacterium]|nr:nuclear transport factor 2 family protein [Porticoccaceae bacterium]